MLGHIQEGGTEAKGNTAICHFTFKNTLGEKKKKVTLVDYVFVLTSVNVFDSDSRRKWVFGSGAVWGKGCMGDVW